jgi:hypothetical protein
MTDSMEIAIALTKISKEILELAKAQRAITLETAKSTTILEELNDKIKVEEVTE